MSRFIDLSSTDKKDFSKWLTRHLERGFLHRLSANEQRTLLYAFAASMRGIARCPEFSCAKAWADALVSRPYTEREALGKITECLELCIDAEQSATAQESVYDRLVFIERYAASFYKTLFEE